MGCVAPWATLLCSPSGPSSSRARSTALSIPPEKRTAVLGMRYSLCMYVVTKRIDFCYGHRLLDYDGVCKHPHGHNAMVEVDVRTGSLDRRNDGLGLSDRPVT